jgi:MoaA/NifB/PqqE/SkfB family radical SAM enzyme
MSDDLSWSAYDFTKIPYDDIQRVGQRTMLYRDLFTVSWLLGRFCNYRCSYCWPYARSDKKDHRPTELCLLTVDEIKRQARERGFNSFHFSLSGGEPTFHPGYIDILNHLNNDAENTNYTSVHMTTNMSRSLRWFEDEYCPAVSKFHRASITASLHTEHVDTPDKMQDFADKLI